MNNQKIAAIFDVDGTLIAGATFERIFIRFLRRRGELGWREILIWIGASIGAGATGPIGGRKVVARESPRLKAIKACLRGKDPAHIRRLAHECFESEIEPRLSPEAVDRL